MAKVKHLLFHSPKLGVSTPLESSLNIVNVQKMRKPLSKYYLLKEFKDNSNVSSEDSGHNKK